MQVVFPVGFDVTILIASPCIGYSNTYFPSVYAISWSFMDGIGTKVTKDRQYIKSLWIPRLEI